ncbi:GIY-YIG nuclease family protein [Patescibacteria group bacterium]|nr:GIY-YIG nuclease family protein [Patescibacteria group bacterium]MBU1472870.1 GIY-YIG nuclease family protein [Patescibacteria group bacterium]MBU2460068.1 GIY-YIG nuclease family protein [Patescibacteria group bacterium]MBU2544764.1 GIY-YIG nuclease family protein [Patescibacteria group bacterium]
MKKKSTARHQSWLVYVLLCLDGSLYTGTSNNPQQRFLDHKNGKGGAYTRSHKPIKIVYLEKAGSKSSALKREAQIKSWPREKKIKILNLAL